MITLMLAVALMTLALLAVLPSIRQQVQRDREEELQHRGTAYMRAIQHFYKKFGRYPTRVEELENTNNLRFLRKRYKDPVNRDAAGKEKEFKLLHQQDISLNNGPVLGQIPGQGLLGGQGGAGGQGGGAGQGVFGNAQGGLGGLPGALGSQAGGIQTPSGTGAQAHASDDSDDAADNPGNSSTPGSPSSPKSGSSSPSSSGLNGPTFGGGPILGVASSSKAKSVRVFFDKSHYNDWLFIYVPTADRGGLLTGPVNPGAPTGNLNGMPSGQGPGGGIGQGQGGLGQGLNPGQTQGPPMPPAQNPGQTPPEQ